MIIQAKSEATTTDLSNEPIEKFKWTLSAVRLFFKMIFQDIFQRDFRYSNGFIVLMTLYVSCMTSCFHSLMYNPDEGMAMMSGATGFGVLEIALKYIFLNDLRPLIDICELITNIYKNNSKTHMKYYELCQSYADRSKLIVKCVVFCYLIIIGLYLTPSILEYFATARVIPCMSLYLRGKEQTTTIGFIILMVYNYSALISCYLTLVSVDMLIITVLASMPMLSEMVIRLLDDLSITLQQNENDSLKIKRHIRKFIMTHNKYNETIKKLTEGFNTACTIQFITASTFSILCIFVIVQENYVGAYGILAAGISQIITYCVLGAIIELSNERISTALTLYDWYLLPYDARRAFAYILHSSQNPKTIYVLYIRPLNMETCIWTLRSIYTYATILYTIVDKEFQ